MSRGLLFVVFWCFLAEEVGGGYAKRGRGGAGGGRGSRDLAPASPLTKGNSPHLPKPMQTTTTNTFFTPAFLSALVHASTVLPVV